MKLIVLLFYFITFQCFAQQSIQFNFSDVYIGRNLSLNWEKTNPKISFGGGFTYHINRIDKIPTNEFIKNAAFADNGLERFGLQLGFEYFIYRNSFCKLGFFLNSQLSTMKQIIKTYIVASEINETQTGYNYYSISKEKKYGPVRTIDNVIGITIRNKFSENIYLSTKGGFGLLFWKNLDDNVLIFGAKKVNQSTNFTSFFSIGLGYTF